jgi:hypothetical protein
MDYHRLIICILKALGFIFPVSDCLICSGAVLMMMQLLPWGGRQPHDVPLLVAARLLKPLGNPAPNGVKYYAAVEIVELTL